MTLFPPRGASWTDGAGAARRTRKPARLRASDRGVTVVEFALVAPLLFLLILGIVVTAIVVTNQVQLSNAVRDGARAAGVCGGASRNQLSPVPSLPDGNACDVSHLTAFIQNRLQAVPGAVNLTVCVGQTGAASTGTDCSSTDASVLDHCQFHYTISVQATYDQPLYIPLVGKFFANDGTGNGRDLSAEAEASCER
ncbi:MAG TPA: TadE family protein [Candidatus Dormibacteraeota bacterium]|nr:TadE family protein [Candidatus Dormibacteraeota bacterium]